MAKHGSNMFQLTQGDCKDVQWWVWRWTTRKMISDLWQYRFQWDQTRWNFRCHVLKSIFKSRPSFFGPGLQPFPFFHMDIGAGVSTFQFLSRPFKFHHDFFGGPYFSTLQLHQGRTCEEYLHPFGCNSPGSLATVVDEGPDASLKIWNKLKLIPSFQ